MTGARMDPVAAQIEALAAELRLPGVRRMYRRLAQEVAAQGGDYLSFLATVLREEVTERESRRIERRMKEAHFPQAKLLSELDFSAQAMPPQAQVMELAKGAYIAEGRNIIALGNPGTGKTHLATGLGIAACRQGLRVRFYGVATLASELEAAQEQHLLHRFLSRFGRWDLVVLDELGYLPLSRTGAELLFQAVGERQERRSLIITSNLPFGDWVEIFHTERLTAALLDRVTHRATILEMNGPSYRLRETLAMTGKSEPGDTD
jgi:DNA replication protein DnaC